MKTLVTACIIPDSGQQIMLASFQHRVPSFLSRILSKSLEHSESAPFNIFTKIQFPLRPAAAAACYCQLRALLGERSTHSTRSSGAGGSPIVSGRVGCGVLRGRSGGRSGGSWGCSSVCGVRIICSVRSVRRVRSVCCCLVRVNILTLYS
jgi:hypothetical protein